MVLQVHTATGTFPAKAGIKLLQSFKKTNAHHVQILT